MNIEHILEQHKLWLETTGEKGERADFSGKDLSDEDLSDEDLRHAIFRGTKLCGTNFRGTKLCGTNFRGANLQYTDSRFADSRFADFHGTKLPEKTFIIQGEPYFVMIANGDNVRAGCQCHSASKWKSFTPAEIEKMDGKQALNFYPRLLEIIDFYCK